MIHMVASVRADRDDVDVDVDVDLDVDPTLDVDGNVGRLTPPLTLHVDSRVERC
jgi:hypothetical protein